MIIKGRRVCDCCKTRKCSKFYKIPLGKPTKKVAYICGRCCTVNARKLRAWIDEEEKKLS